MEKDIKTVMAEAGRAHDDPVLSIVMDLGTAFERSIKNIEAQIETIGKHSDKAAEILRTELDKFKTEVDKGFDFQLKKLEGLDKRTHVLSWGGGGNKTDKLLEGIADNERWLVGLCQKTYDPVVDKGEFKDPIFKAASALWFDHSMRAQHKQWAAKREYHLKRMEQLEQAFRDAYRVPIELIEKAAFTTATDTLGGHLVPDPVEAEMNRLIADNSILRQAGVRTIPMVTKTLDLPKEGSSSLGVAIENEGAAITDSVPASNAVAKVTLTAKRFDGYAAASLESIQDSAISVLTWVQEKLTELIGTLEDTQALEGTSSFTGLAADTDVNEIAAQTNGDAITYAKLVSIVFKARQRTSRQLARFFMAPEAMAKVVGLRADAVTAADGAGVPIFQFGNVPGTIQMTLLGFPVEVHSGIRIDRTKGSGTALTNIYFGPPRQITFGDRTGMSWDVSDVASMVVGGVTTSAFQTYSVHMRLIKRTAIAVAVGKAFTRAVDLITT